MLFIYFKKIVCLCILFSIPLFISAQTTLTPGDIAIVGVNTDNPDEFSFVLLTDIESGTEIFFTDSGIKSDGAFRPNEGAVLYTAPTALSFGTVITFTGISGDFTDADDSIVGNNGFNLSGSGDQIIAFGGSTASPTFIFAVQTNSNQFQTNSDDANQSDLPPGLTVGLNAVAVGSGSGAESEFDNSVYNLSVTTGDKATLLNAIANNANWNGSNTRIDNLPVNGDFSGGTTPNEIVVTGNNTVISNGDITPSTTDNTDFGISEINNIDVSVFSITNSTGANINITNIIISGTDASSFSLANTTPGFPFSIADTETQEISIEYTSNIAGTKTATIEIVSDFNNFIFNISATSIDTSSPTLIHDFQGNGTASPLAGQVVTIEGIVVGDFQDVVGSNGDLNGFFVQEEDSDKDAEVSTSEGIFIFDGFSPTVNVAEGDKVSITGEVVEFFGVTELTNVTNVSIVSTSNTLPAATSISLPATNTVLNANGNSIPDLENVEGMLVNFPQTLTISELFNLDRFGEMRLVQDGRIKQYTQDNVPSTTGFTNHLQDVAKRTIVLDDGFSIQNPDPIRYPDGNLNTNDSFRMGNTVENLTGVVHYSRASGGSGTETYRIHPTVNPSFTTINTRSETPEDVGGNLKITSFNVLNYFKTIDISGAMTAIGGNPRGADNRDEFERQRTKLINALIAINADVLGLVELENDFLPGSSGNAIEDLVTGLNEALGETIYAWVDPGTQFVGDDVIATGLIYKPSKVMLATNTTIEILTDAALAGLGLPTSPAVFNGNSTNRSPIAVTFEEVSSNEIFTVAVTHFKSKGSPGTAGAVDEDQNDGAGNGNQTRLNGVEALSKWLDTDPTGSNDVDFVLLGDFNAYAKEDPITFLESEGYVNIAESIIDSEVYSFVFDGQIGTLDYAFVSPGLLLNLTGVTEWHVNADEADAIDYNLDFGRNPAIFDGNVPYRNSDHDPIVFGLDLTNIVLENEDFVNLEEQINIFPVPVQNTLTIISKELVGPITFNIFSPLGILISSEIVESNENSIHEINTSKLASGTYLLLIENSGNTITKLFVK